MNARSDESFFVQHFSQSRQGYAETLLSQQQLHLPLHRGIASWKEPPLLRAFAFFSIYSIVWHDAAVALCFALMTR